jgi:hypothetical protein
LRVSGVVKEGQDKMVSPQIGKDEMGEDAEKKTEYAIKQVGDRYYPVIIDREAGGHYEIKTP